MATELLDIKTPISKQEAIEALWDGYLRFFASAPKPECIQVIASQWGLETGWGASMHAWNFGNVKSVDGDGFDYVYFACNELLPVNTALAYANADPNRAKITATREDGNAWIWFYPKHRGCRFRAFMTPEAGAADHVALLVKHFPAAMRAAQAGDPALYAHALKMSGYYTADEASYTKGLVGCMRAVQGLPQNFDQLPVLTDSQREQIEGWMAMAFEIGVQDALSACDQARRDANRG